ncbi:hypothetical protein BJ875DRAFT_437803 [Amylocarpus encephaloides]|uniref:Uncharacterized protein n=1 Tax=Amylocarpus encephaloides TaxID=45428 RepID=A0A9P8C8R4_9HELO|nr:hypothetical protein BJ875DRAFT_437803 [Amylocarpus encephaloides]
MLLLGYEDGDRRRRRGGGGGGGGRRVNTEDEDEDEDKSWVQVGFVLYVFCRVALDKAAGAESGVEVALSVASASSQCQSREQPVERAESTCGPGGEIVLHVEYFVLRLRAPGERAVVSSSTQAVEKCPRFTTPDSSQIPRRTDGSRAGWAPRFTQKISSSSSPSRRRFSSLGCPALSAEPFPSEIPARARRAVGRRPLVARRQTTSGWDLEHSRHSCGFSSYLLYFEVCAGSTRP